MLDQETLPIDEPTAPAVPAPHESDEFFRKVREKAGLSPRQPRRVTNDDVDGDELAEIGHPRKEQDRHEDFDWMEVTCNV